MTAVRTQLNRVNWFSVYMPGARVTRLPFEFAALERRPEPGRLSLVFGEGYAGLAVGVVADHVRVTLGPGERQEPALGAGAAQRLAEGPLPGLGLVRELAVPQHDFLPEVSGERGNEDLVEADGQPCDAGGDGGGEVAAAGEGRPVAEVAVGGFPAVQHGSEFFEVISGLGGGHLLGGAGDAFGAGCGAVAVGGGHEEGGEVIELGEGLADAALAPAAPGVTGPCLDAGGEGPGLVGVEGVVFGEGFGECLAGFPPGPVANSWASLLVAHAQTME